MTQRLKPIALAIVCVALGAAIQRAYDTRQTIGRQLATRTQESNPPTTARAVRLPAPPWTAAEVDRSRVDYSKQPLWAWGVDDPPKSDEKQAVQGAPGQTPANQNQSVPAEELNRKQHVDGSKFEYSIAQIRASTSGNFVDWFPEDHPNPVPDIITRGPAALGKDSRPCGSCHLSDGSGRPENASPAGLPAGYLIRQLTDFRNDLRHSANPRKGNSNTMVMLAKAMSDDEIRQAADYFSAVAWRPHVQVVETTRVPETRIQGELFIPIATERTEPIGNRIIEVPADVESNQTLRNSRGTWIAYVPPGTVKKGKDLVTTGGMKVVNGQIVQGKSTACGTCHGPDLMGVPPDVPSLVGRSPSYLAREIFDIQQGMRRGSNSNVPLMKMVVEKLTPEDILTMTAYLASLPVRRGTPPPQDFIARR